MSEKRKTKTSEEKKAVEDNDNRLDIVELQKASIKELNKLANS